MFDIPIRISRSMSILMQYFDLNTATAEKLVSHKYDVAKTAQEHGELCSLQVEIQLEP